MHNCATESLSVTEARKEIATTSPTSSIFDRSIVSATSATSATSTSFDLCSESYRSQRHPTHYYDDGNIIVVVENVIFKLHKSMLAGHSMTFGGMFDVFRSAGLVDPQSEEVQTVPLHDEIEIFEGLIDALYCGLSFVESLNPRHCLKVLEIARKYEVGSVEKFCRRYLVQKLPVSAVDPFEDWDSFQLYYKGDELASLAFQICPEYLAPWAFYVLTVQTLSKLNKKPIHEVTDPLSSFDSMDKSTIYQMFVVQHVNQKILTEWNGHVDKFYSTKCPKASSSRDKCARAHTTFNQQSPLFISPKDEFYDPLQLIIPRIKKYTAWKGSVHGSLRNYWCHHCSMTLQEIARERIQEIHLCLLGSVRELGLPRGTPFHTPSSTRADCESP